jgi:UDP-glucose 4-epimerase
MITQMANNNLQTFFKGKKALVTGGLGFIGINIIKRLLDLGAEITAVDNFVSPELRKLLASVYSQLNIVVADIRDEDKVERVVREQDIIFNMAGKSGAADSNKTPMNDLDVNCRGHLTVLEACRRFNPCVTIIFPSSRLVYGKPLYLPVDEAHPLAPDSIYAVHKLTVENYHLIYSKLYGLKTTVLRISNPYGPMQIESARPYGIANKFIQSAVKGEQITIFGEGVQQRDYIYIDDLVQAFMMTGLKQEASGKVYNIGDAQTVSLLDLAQLSIEVAGSGKIVKVPWPDEYGAIETGDYQSNIDLASKELEWRPTTALTDGINKTVEFYRHF